MLQRYISSISKSVIVISILIIVACLASCGSHPRAQVSERNPPPSKRISAHHVVKGDTLFSIAWRYGLDYRQLAYSNRISQPYTIYPGQTIYLHPQQTSASAAAVRASNSATKPPPMATNNTNKASQNTAKSAPPPLITPPKNNNSRSENGSKASPQPVRSPLVLGTPQWQWPAQGKLISVFQGTAGLNKGIDIAGNLGQPVIAAAAGQVVYAGSGLRGYGKLLIIKHNETFLSAYAHNEHLLVAEGDNVKAGQKIADMGSSGADRTKLHFEIRRDGTPVDPLKYLPRR